MKVVSVLFLLEIRNYEMTEENSIEQRTRVMNEEIYNQTVIRWDRVLFGILFQCAVITSMPLVLPIKLNVASSCQVPSEKPEIYRIAIF